MSILTDLETALEWQQGCDERHVACVPSPCKLTYDLLDLDTIAALVAVARAVDDENNSSGEAARQAYVRGRTALASLVKEDSDCSGNTPPPAAAREAVKS